MQKVKLSADSEFYDPAKREVTIKIGEVGQEPTTVEIYDEKGQILVLIHHAEGHLTATVCKADSRFETFDLLDDRNLSIVAVPIKE